MTFGMSLLLGELARLYSVALRVREAALGCFCSTPYDRAAYGTSWISSPRTVVLFQTGTQASEGHENQGAGSMRNRTA